MSLAQIELSGEVISVQSNQVLSGVQITNESGQLLAVSNEKGKFNLTLSGAQKIVFNHVSHESLLFSALQSATDLIITLDPKKIELPEASVSAKLPEIVYSNEKFHVADYEFTNDGLYVLTYTKKKYFKEQKMANCEILQDCQVLLLNSDLELKAKSSFYSEGLSLHADSYGQVFLKCKNEVYFIYTENEQIYSSEMSQSDFDLTIEPLVFKNKNLSIVSSYDSTFPEFSYFVTNSNDQLEFKLCTITDSVMMHTFRAEYRDLQPREKLEAFRAELKTGIDKEIISGYMTGFHSSIYFKPPFAPLFGLDTGLVVFNTLKNRMQFYNFHGGETQTVKFDFHHQPRKTGWRNKLKQDVKSKTVYGVFEKNGHVSLKEVEFDSGELKGEFTLSYKYPINIQIKDGYVYYLYRPFETSQKHYLYKEQISIN